MRRGKKQIEFLHFSEETVTFSKSPEGRWNVTFFLRNFNNWFTPRLLSDAHPADLLLPPRPGTVPPILTWPAPTAPGMVTVPGSSLPISEHKNRAGLMRKMKKIDTMYSALAELYFFLMFFSINYQNIPVSFLSEHQPVRTIHISFVKSAAIANTFILVQKDPDWCCNDSSKQSITLITKIPWRKKWNVDESLCCSRNNM